MININNIYNRVKELVRNTLVIIPNASDASNNSDVYYSVGDINFTLYSLYKEGNITNISTITDDTVASLDLSKKAILREAFKNTEERFPAKYFLSPNNYANKKCINSIEECKDLDMIVVSSDSEVGATAIHYESTREFLLKSFGEGVLITFPGSDMAFVHRKGTISVQELKGWISDLNKFLPKGKRFLSENVYTYSNGLLKLVN